MYVCIHVYIYIYICNIFDQAEEEAIEKGDQAEEEPPVCQDHAAAPGEGREYLHNSNGNDNDNDTRST